MSWKGVKKQTNIENIKVWCEKMGIRNYIINSQCEIDVDGGVFLRNKNFKELPYKFGRVSGNFNIGYNADLISLKNCPNYVEDSFSCDYCLQLDSLEGCPEEVGGWVFCYDCKRKFSKKEIKSLCKVKGYVQTKYKKRD